MSKESQEAHALELEHFTKIAKEDSLRRFEAENRGRISAAPIHIKLAFDERWTALTGTSYFIPVTRTITQAPAETVLCPRDTLYRVQKRVTGVLWEKISDTRKLRSSGTIKTFDRYYLRAVLPDGSVTTIEYKLDRDQLEFRLGKRIADMITSQKGPSGTVSGLDDVIPVIGYWQVQFAPKGSPADTESVILSWEGICLQIERGKRVVLPGYYLEVSDNGIYPLYKQNPEHPRKIVAWVQFYPYTVMREATEAEFLDTKARGDLLRREAQRLEEGK